MSGFSMAIGRLTVGLAAVIVITADIPVTAAPVYNHGQTGTFGQIYQGSNGTIAHTFNDPAFNDRYSASFTSFETVTIDSVWQNYRFVAQPNNQIRVGIQADAGGSPSGAYLVSGVGTAPLAPATALGLISFDNPFELQPNTVYHLVTEVVAFDPSEDAAGFQIMRSNFDTGVRPFDHRLDASFRSMTQDNGGAWTAVGEDPFFVFENGGSVVAAPGQPYVGTTANQFQARGDGDNRGQQFQILDTEVPTGAVVWVDSVTIDISLNQSTVPLILRFREADGTVLASAVLPASTGTGEVTVALDNTVILSQGETYLFTTELQGGAIGDRFLFRGMQGAVATWGAATWGGDHLTSALSYAITTSNNWSTFAARTDRTHSELEFYFSGAVYIPEPASMMVLSAAAIVLPGRRRPSRRRQR